MTSTRVAFRTILDSGAQHTRIEPLVWHDPKGNPFSRHQDRPLRVTLDASSFSGLTTAQEHALELLREFSHLESLDTVDTAPGSLRRLTFGAVNREGQVPFAVYEGPQRLRGSSLASSEYDHLRSWAPALARQHDPNHPNSQEALRSLLVLEAHLRLRRDLLVTESAWPFDQRVVGISRAGNPRRILDAAKIVGLFLRSRDSYVYWIEKPGFSESFDRGLYYWVLTRHRTPSMWRYLSACVYAEAIRGDSSDDLGQSILLRCDRAIQARDRIGQAFYGGQDANSRDEVMYHFDYLALLLAGALDAQARVAHRVYRLPGTERRATFRNGSWVRLVGKAAPRLHKLMTNTRVCGVLGLLYEVRNTIHAASLSNMGYRVPSQEGVSRIEVADAALAKAIRAAASSVGSRESWGLSVERYREEGDPTVRELMMLEPYAYADTLVRECLGLVDDVASATEVERLFKGQPVPPLLDGPPDDHTFNVRIRERLALLD